jgi:hypothetical protein
MKLKYLSIVNPLPVLKKIQRQQRKLIILHHHVCVTPVNFLNQLNDLPDNLYQPHADSGYTSAIRLV